jgi:chemotaxis protein MotB
MMFARRFERVDDDEHKDIFAPVADLMVGVVFIFIVLMIALVLNLQKEDTVPKSEYLALEAKNAELQQQLSQALARAEALASANERLVGFARFVRDSDVIRTMSQLASVDQTRTQLLEEMHRRLAAAGIEVNVNAGAGTLMLPSRRLFDVGKAEPTNPEGLKVIMQLGSVMSDVLPCYSGVGRTQDSSCGLKVGVNRLNAVYIEGHTDVTPFSTAGARFADNWDLSAGRAIEAYKLISKSSERLQNLKNEDGDALVGVSGYADTRPAVHDAPDRKLPEIADKDRRIEVRIIMTANEELVVAALDQLNSHLRDIDDLVAR